LGYSIISTKSGEVWPSFFGSSLEVVLIMGDEIFRLAGKVKHPVNINSMGVELSVPSRNYCEFVSTVQDYCYRKLS